MDNPKEVIRQVYLKLEEELKSQSTDKNVQTQMQMLALHNRDYFEQLDYKRKLEKSGERVDDENNYLF